MAEWLCSGLQSRLRRFDSGFSLHMNVGIIGFGFVGKALKSSFNNKVNYKIIDPNLKTNIDDLVPLSPNIVFVCVPTPMNDDGTQNIKILKKVIDELEEKLKNTKIVIKSTVLPDYLNELSKKNIKLVYNPEFLRESFANNVFINAKFILFGSTNDNYSNELSEFYKCFTNCKTNDYIKTDLLTASLVKYTINSYLASKVVFFNELFEVFSSLNHDVGWDNFIKILQMDPRIGSSHMEVPGHDGMKGFGGACFPKDINALYDFSVKKEKSMDILKYVISKNNTIRKSYNKTTEREKEQNINFDTNQD